MIKNLRLTSSSIKVANTHGRLCLPPPHALQFASLCLWFDIHFCNEKQTRECVSVGEGAGT
jgi:hypothetical protein